MVGGRQLLFLIASSGLIHLIHDLYFSLFFQHFWIYPTLRIVFSVHYSVPMWPFYPIWCVRPRRVDIWRDRCDRRSCKILVSGVNFQENNANWLTILPEKKFMVPVLITIDAWYVCIWVICCCILMFVQSLHKVCVIIG